MGNLNDIMVDFVEGIKPETLVVGHNEEFFKVFPREVEIYEKRGGKGMAVDEENRTFERRR